MEIEIETKKSQVKHWISQELKIDSTCMVLLSEVNCMQNPESRETMILVMQDCDKSFSKVYKIPKCIVEIEQSDICKILSTQPFQTAHLSKHCQGIMNVLFSKDSEQE
jgi:hypothetical protein